jgi:peptidoglycan hydrolase-like protein with peptidoglycan-binding domain
MTKTIELLLVVLITALPSCSMFNTTPTKTALPPPPAISQRQADMRDSSETQAQIIAVQSKLAREGLFTGQIDGRWGPATSSALSRYQQNHNLLVTGKLDKPTLDMLGN